MTARRQLRGGPVDPAPPFWEPLQLLQRSIEKPKPARIRSAFDVVIGRGELNEALQKNVNVRLRLEPDRLPRFVRIPELASVEMIEPGAEVCGEVWSRGQSPALVPRRNVSHIAIVKSAVVPVPPMSRVRCSGPESSTFVIASSTRFAAPDSPM